MVTGTSPGRWFTWIAGRVKMIGPRTWPVGPGVGARVTTPPADVIVQGIVVSYTGAGRLGWLEMARLVSSPIGISMVTFPSVTAESVGFETMIWRSTLFGLPLVAEARIGLGVGRNA
jgi:hypothetical protein